MNLHQRKSTRLKGFDYSSANMYFVTLCTKNKIHLFGEITNEEMKLNWKGKIIYECWENLPNHYSNITLDKFVIMPNHFHGLISIIDNSRGEVTSPDIEHSHKTGRETLPLPIPFLSKIIAYFKYLTTKRINKKLNTPGSKIWQRSFYDHIIRNDEDYYNTQSYIELNPIKWEWDSENKKEIQNEI